MLEIIFIIAAYIFGVATSPLFKMLWNKYFKKAEDEISKLGN